MSKARYGFIYLLTLRLSTTGFAPLDSYLARHFGQYSSVFLALCLLTTGPAIFILFILLYDYVHN